MFNTIDTLIGKYKTPIVRSLIGFLLFLYVIYRDIGLTFLHISTEDMIAINVAIFTFMLYSISVTRPKQPEIDVFEDQVKMVQDVSAYISQNDVKHATIIQYSGVMITNTLLELMKKGVNVSLWLHNPETAVSTHQRDRILSSINGMEDQLKTSYEGKRRPKLTIYYYDAPASIRGILVDDKMLIIGWYTYNHQIKAHPKDDAFKIAGHNKVSLRVDKEDPGFNSLRSMFQAQIMDYEQHKNATGQKAVLVLPSE